MDKNAYGLEAYSSIRAEIRARLDAHFRLMLATSRPGTGPARSGPGSGKTPPERPTRRPERPTRRPERPTLPELVVQG